MKNKNEKLFLLTAIDEQNYFHFKFVYDELELKFANRVMEIPKVQLKIWKQSERHECYNNFTDRLNINTINDFEIFDGIYINMISGMDIRVEDIEMIRAKYSGPIYIDIHTLARGVNEKGQRYFRKIPEVKRWLSSVDFVQVNEHELLTLSELENEKEIVKFVFDQGCSAVIVTNAENGGRIYSNINSNEKIFSYNATEVKSVNKVGCGDVFGSVWFYNFLLTANVQTSINIAKKTAGILSTYSEIKQIKNLKQDTNEFKN